MKGMKAASLIAGVATVEIETLLARVKELEARMKGFEQLLTDDSEDKPAIREIRQLDFAGRVLLPKRFRNQGKWGYGDPIAIELFLDTDGEGIRLVLRKVTV